MPVYPGIVSDHISMDDDRKFKRTKYDDSLYLDTIDRSKLDFDFEKLCSQSLSNVNIYACLCCGKYFQGRGPTSYAYLHSVDVDHHVFINVSTLKVYVLPENYEVTSSSLDDIKYQVDPWYTDQQVQMFDSAKYQEASRDISGSQYLPGFMGINNIKANDYANVIIQIIAHIGPLRDFLVLNSRDSRSEMVKRLGTLIRKLWNPRAFRPHVSPHELLQHISVISAKRFTPIEQKDPFAFLNWFLNHLNLDLGGSLKRSNRSTIVHECFQGQLFIEQQKVIGSANAPTKNHDNDSSFSSSSIPFMFLALDLPPAPLFQNNLDPASIPQVLLTTLLEKYSGSKIQELPGFRKRYSIVKLPQYLIFHINRLEKSAPLDQRNPTVVSFSPTSLDMSLYTKDSSTAAPQSPQVYDLIANVVADWPDKTHPRWKIQLLSSANNKWIQIEDLLVEQVQRETLFLSESHIQVWKRR